MNQWILGSCENSIKNDQMSLLLENLLLWYIFFNQFLRMCLAKEVCEWDYKYFVVQEFGKGCVWWIFSSPFKSTLYPLLTALWPKKLTSNALCRLGSLALWLSMGWINRRHQQQTHGWKESEVSMFTVSLSAGQWIGRGAFFFWRPHPLTAAFSCSSVLVLSLFSSYSFWTRCGKWLASSPRC